MRITLKSLPYFVIFTTLNVSSKLPINCIGPSAMGLKNKFLLSLYAAIHPVLLHTAI